MVSIAEASGANYYYVKDAEKLPGVFEKELGRGEKRGRAGTVHHHRGAGVGSSRSRSSACPMCVSRDARQLSVSAHFTPPQRRDLLVRCRVKSPQSDSAEIGRAHIVLYRPRRGQDSGSGRRGEGEFQRSTGGRTGKICRYLCRDAGCLVEKRCHPAARLGTTGRRQAQGGRRCLEGAGVRRRRGGTGVEKRKTGRRGP